MDKFKLEGILEGRDTVYFDDFENIKHKDVLRIINQHKSEGFFYGSTWHEENIEIDKFVVFLLELGNSGIGAYPKKIFSVSLYGIYCITGQSVCSSISG